MDRPKPLVRPLENQLCSSFVRPPPSAENRTPYLGMLESSDQKVIFSNWSQIVQILRLDFSEFDSDSDPCFHSDHPSGP